MTEKEMIYLYRNEHCEQIRDLIYERNKEMLDALTCNLFSNTIKNFTYEKEDWLSNSYLAFVRCLRQYDIKQTKYTFAQALAVANKSIFVRESKRETSLYNRATTCGVHNIDQYEFCANNVVNIGISNDEERMSQEIQLQQINEFLKHYNIKNRRNIEMRMQGYTNKEISKKLHISARRTRNMYYRVRNEFIRRYKKNINYTWQ
ncbi:MAG: hypothetical protein LBT17_00520 [Mycoplasmataceae bacterium]|nr:hypothetical protein [Mycoplasmataceae bacterium]